MNKILIVFYAACVAAASAFVMTSTGTDDAPVLMANANGEPT